MRRGRSNGRTAGVGGLSRNPKCADSPAMPGSFNYRVPVTKSGPQSPSTVYVGAFQAFRRLAPTMASYVLVISSSTSGAAAARSPPAGLCEPDLRYREDTSPSQARAVLSTALECGERTSARHLRIEAACCRSRASDRGAVLVTPRSNTVIITNGRYRHRTAGAPGAVKRRVLPQRGDCLEQRGVSAGWLSLVPRSSVGPTPPPALREPIIHQNVCFLLAHPS
jgi:hypothetical protein